MTKQTFIIMAAAILGLFSCVARATLVPIAITGEVTYVDDDDGLLGGDINVGDIITGVYIYDSSTPDSDPGGNGGSYRHYSPPAGITLTVGGLVFMTDPDDVYFIVRIANDMPPGIVGSGLSDGYGLRSEHNLPLPDPDGALVTLIRLSLFDRSFSALSSDALPTTAPVLDDWEKWDENIVITGGHPRGPRFEIKGDLTSAVLIPEPTTISLFIIGALTVLRKRRSWKCG